MKPDNMPQQRGSLYIDPECLVGDVMDDEVAKSLRDYITSIQVPGLEKLREPFPPEEIEKRAQAKFKGGWEGQRSAKCDECHRWHPPDNTLHLDYVGHARITKRLLDVDPFWEWDFLATDANGMPIYDNFNGLWITLTVCGVTRKGYGHAGNKSGGDAVKEIIGDAIRNAAMRFGCGLHLWIGVADDVAAEGETHEGPRKAPGGRGPSRGNRKAAAAKRPVNQAELDEITRICDKYGYGYQETEQRFRDEYGTAPADADSGVLRAFANILVEQATAEPAGVGAAGGEDESGPAEAPGAGASEDDDDPWGIKNDEPPF